MDKREIVISPVELGKKATLFALGAIGVITDETKRVFSELVKKGEIYETRLSKKAGSIRTKVKGNVEEAVEVVKEKVNSVKAQVQEVLPIEKKEN